MKLLTSTTLVILLVAFATLVCDVTGSGRWPRFGRSISYKSNSPKRVSEALAARGMLDFNNDWAEPSLDARNIEKLRYVYYSHKN